MTTFHSRVRRIAGGLILALLVPPVVQAQQAVALDRTKQPPVGPTPVLRVPPWTRTTLSNGAELIVSEKHDLPLVAFNISLVGGRYQLEPKDKLGVGNLTAAMMSEGTTTRTGDELADAQLLLGTNISVGIGGESGSMGFTSLRDKVEPTLALVADMLMNPSFPEDALERLRARTLVQLTQQKDQPGAIAANVFGRVLYGDEHPYGGMVTEQTIRNISRDDIVAFHRAYFQPGRAIITVVGDVDPATVRRQIEAALTSWRRGGERPAFTYPAPPPSRGTTIYLVDKPNSAQSVFALGHPGPNRDTPDYFALQVMNTILGGLFQSRLNANIREEKGYSYGVRSSFQYGRGPGAFRAGGDIVTAKTDSALIEFMRELRGVQGGRPFTEDEITQGKESLIQRLPQAFASVNATASAIASLYVQGLPETYYQDYAARINAVTADDLLRVARQYIDLDHLNMVIVGDRATIENALRATGIAGIEFLDIEGNAVAGGGGAGN